MQNLSQRANETNNTLRYAQAGLDNNTNVPSHSKLVFSVQNFSLVWLDINIVESNDDFRNAIAKLRQIVNRIDVFTDVDQCINFLTKNENEKISIKLFVFFLS